MKNRLDFKSLAAAALGQANGLLSRWVPDGHSSGNEFKGLNPRRADSTPGSFSVNLTTGAWADFSPAAGEQAKGGDLISLYAYLNAVSNGEAFKAVQAQIGAAPTKPREPKPDSRGEQLLIAPTDAPPCPTVRKVKTDAGWQEYPITFTWAYRNAMGALLFYVCRYQTPQGKEVLPLTLHRGARGLKWEWRAYPEPRPLYNLDKLAHAPQAQVIVVEGEKCAEALQGMIEGAGAAAALVAVTWQGGGKATGKADWAPLAGRRVVLWPDHDEAGLLAMQDIAGRIDSSEILLLNIPSDKPEKWDVADAILGDRWGLPEIIAFIKANRGPVPTNEPDPNPDQAPATQTDDIGEPADAVEAPDSDHLQDAPFRCLGHDGEYCYYLPRGTAIPKAIKGESHNAAALVCLAPKEFWERQYPSKKGPVWSEAINDLLRASEAVGYYNRRNIRGLGAWHDSGRAVVHLGDRLIIDGKESDLFALGSRYIYELRPLKEEIIAYPATKFEAHKIKDILDDISWELPIHSAYVAGWIAIAPICGALKWRPHLWITGEAGSGKSFVIDEIIKRCLGDFRFSVQSTTSAAGIRQELRNDGLAVTFDEFEGEDHKAKSRVQEVIELARQASTDSGAGIFKGTQSGKAMHFDIRSAFLMSSVGVNLTMHSDETRVTVVSIRKRPPTNENQQHFQNLQSTILSTLSDDFCAKFRARSVKMIPIIMKNADLFASTICGKLGSRRTGDQIGSLLAGAYSLSSDGEISPEAAIKWVDSQDWSEQKDIADGGGDSRRCLDEIMTHCVRMTPTKAITVSELIQAVQIHDTSPTDEWPEGEQVERTELSRMGIRMETDEGLIFIAEGHKRIKEMLRDSPHQSGYSRILRRLPNVVERPSMRFIGCVKKAIGIPWNTVFGENPA